HCHQAVGKLLAAGHAKRDRRVDDLALRPAEALRDGGLGNEEGPRDLRRREASHRAKGQGDLCLARERGMAAGEDELETLVRQRARGPHRGFLQLGDLFLVSLLAPQPVDALAARRGHEPGAGVVRNAFAGPMLECRNKRVLDALLGEVEVTEPLGERRGEPSGLLVEDRGHRVARDLGVQCTTIGRTSTSPPGQLFAIEIAASRSGTSIMMKPPTCSLDSIKGPSVTFMVPFCRRTVVAGSFRRSSSPPLPVPLVLSSSSYLLICGLC